jgi:hypothetical protein
MKIRNSERDTTDERVTSWPKILSPHKPAENPTFGPRSTSGKTSILFTLLFGRDLGLVFSTLSARRCLIRPTTLYIRWDFLQDGGRNQIGTTYGTKILFFALFIVGSFGAGEIWLFGVTLC